MVRIHYPQGLYWLVKQQGLGSKRFIPDISRWLESEYGARVQFYPHTWIDFPDEQSAMLFRLKHG